MTPFEALMLRFNNGFCGTCGCIEHEELARHVLVDLAFIGRWDVSLKRANYREKWTHFHTSSETMPPCEFGRYVEFDRDGAMFIVNQKFIDAMCKAPSHLQVDDGPYDTMPVAELIDCLLTVIPDSPMHWGIRGSLKAIKDSIFLELPETRCELLCRIGTVINKYVPDRTKGNGSYVDPLWDRVKVIMEKSFARYREKQK